MRNKQSITDLLPEGVTEETVDKIIEVFNTEYEDRINEAIRDLGVKVKSFIRSNIDTLKEQALKEMELENEHYRNSQLFEVVRSIFAVELSEKDSNFAIQNMSEEVEDSMKQVEFLLDQNKELNESNRKLKTQKAALSAKVQKILESAEALAEQNNQLLEENRLLSEAEPEPFNSSEKAFVRSKVDEGLNEGSPKIDNEYITEEVLRLSQNR
jgi:uncharacterized protein (DUF3084 family)